MGIQRVFLVILGAFLLLLTAFPVDYAKASTITLNPVGYNAYDMYDSETSICFSGRSCGEISTGTPATTLDILFSFLSLPSGFAVNSATLYVNLYNYDGF
jgi:hypothetical protein